MSFSTLDWTIVVASLVLVFWTGMLGRKYVKNSTDFLVAGRGMGMYVGTISLVSTEIGIITYMYYAEMGTLFGFTAFLSGLISAAVYIFLGKTGFVIKKFRELELLTIPQFFQDRYGTNVRVIAGILMAVGGALNFGVFPIIEATFLNIMTGIPQSLIILTMVFMMAMVLLYTAMGGMVSVLITNYVQYVVLAVAMILITFFCFWEVGWSPMVETVQNHLGEEGFNPLIHPSFGWNFILWQTLAWVASLTAWAPVAVRAFSAENPEVGKRIFRWTGVIFLGRALMPMLWGIAAMVYLGPDLIGSDIPAIEATPRFLQEILPFGIKGLVVAGMLAASMSTYSGYLLAWGSVISQDVVIPLLGGRVSQKVDMILNRVTILLLSVFIIIWGLFYVIPGATFFYLQMCANIFLAGTFWSLIGGLYWKKAHKLGAYCALFFGSGATLTYFLIPNPESMTGAIGVASYLFAFVGMVAGSLIGTHIRSFWARTLSVAALVVTLAAAVFAYGFLPTISVWLSLWFFFLFFSVLLFVLLSSVAIRKGWPELLGMLRRLLGKE